MPRPRHAFLRACPREMNHGEPARIVEKLEQGVIAAAMPTNDARRNVEKRMFRANFEFELTGEPIALVISPSVSGPPRFEPFGGHRQLPEVVQRKVFTTPP
ncbi:hypothetical protein [Neorhodopirellula lusitana]|uniref:hypothetical protein n=1 Tax=Neorhodopirellula lusitana TaxID=445327 RepID=UPI0024B66C67|nr:hypothetical protein [Neorhodopirellula lusitana]